MDKIAIDGKVCLYELLPADPVKLIEADSRSEAVGLKNLSKLSKSNLVQQVASYLYIVIQ